MPYLLRKPDDLIAHWVRKDETADVSPSPDQNLEDALNWFEKVDGWNVVSVFWSGVTDSGVSASKILLHKEQ